MKKIIVLLSIAFGVALAAFSMSLLRANAKVAAPQDGPDAAQVIVQYAPGDIDVKPISFTAPISGMVALEYTGLEIVTKDYGDGWIAVCSIGGVGCPADNCFCDDSKYWNYSFWDGSTWQSYGVGAADSTVYDNAIEGWRWGEETGNPIPPPAVAHALEWLRDQQNPDGGYGSTSSTLETALSIGSADLNAADWRKQPEYHSLMGYLLTNGSDYSKKGAGESGKLATGLVSANGCNPYLALQPMDYYDPLTGQFNSHSIDHLWGMLGTTALSQTIPQDAVTYTKNQIQPDGGWEFNIGSGSDSNTTALAVQALIAGGESPATTEVINGINYLDGSQNSDGGFYYNNLWGTESDTNSTAYAVQAIVAAGEDPTSGRWVISETNPISYLLNMQLPDGSFEWKPSEGSNLFATQQAIPALMYKYNPIRVATLPVCPTVFFPLIYR